ncbi:MAG: hypothetical protein IJK23_00180 [Clostridia bacterium]|nr:hypothetical protein [Clostridia bacterium]
MKNGAKKTIAVLLSVLLLFSAMSAGSFAADTAYGPYEYDDIATGPDGPREPVKSASMKPAEKFFYNALNFIADGLLKVIVGLYPAPSTWKNVDEFDDTYYLKGRETYATEAAEDNFWSVGYGSRSIIPDDFTADKYYIGRDLTNRLAQGINDDCRVRAAAFDDNSGEGIVIFAAADALGVTSADTLAVRENVIKWAEEQGVKIAALNLSATHSHSAIDAQGVATESIYKLLTAGFKNMFRIDKDQRLENAENFKKFYIGAITEAVKEAIGDMKAGKLYYAKVDFDEYHVDKRGLIADEDLPDTAMFKFVPDDGSAGLVMADIACHPTTFSAGNGLFSGDYIYYMEQRIEEKTGCRFLFTQGASGQVSKKNVGVDESKLPEEERLGATTRYVGKVFADLLIGSELEELPPVLNAKYTNFMYTPTNLILALAVKAQLVNNQVYRDGLGLRNIKIAMEEGYVEFGGRVGLCLFPVELYPEVFRGVGIINGGDYAAVSWDGGDWDAPVPEQLAPREGIDMFALHLCNDSLGYCVPDNNFAFFGHIIGDEIADETLSLGKNTASMVVSEFEKLMRSF